MTAPETQNNQHGRRLGEMIRRERAGRLTLRELAKLASLSVGSASQIERGPGNPSFNTLTKIAGAPQVMPSPATPHDRTGGRTRPPVTRS